MNHYIQGVSDNSSPVQRLHLHPENLWLKFWCQADWAIQMTKHSSFYPISLFLLTKQIHFTCPHQSLYHDVADPNAHSLITSPGATRYFLSLLSCPFQKLPAPLSFSCAPACPVWPAVCIVTSPGELQAFLWCPTGCPIAVDLARPVVEVAVWISGLSWGSAAAACCLIQLGLHSHVSTAFDIPPESPTSHP